MTIRRSLSGQKASEEVTEMDVIYANEEACTTVFKAIYKGNPVAVKQVEIAKKNTTLVASTKVDQVKALAWREIDTLTAFRNNIHFVQLVGWYLTESASTLCHGMEP